MTEADLAFAFAEQAIKEATELETPDLYFNSRNYTALERLPEHISKHLLLYRLQMTGTQVSDLTPISSLVQLKELWIQDTPVHDLSPLSRLVDLEELVLSKTNVVDITPLGYLTSLKCLTVNDSTLVSIAGLSRLQQLEELEIRGTQVKDVSPLSELPNLKLLNLRKTPIVDLRPLRNVLHRVASGLAPFPLLDGCAAVQVDPNIAEIIQLKDERASGRILLEYLEDWEPPVEAVDLREANLPQPGVAPLATQVTNGRLRRRHIEELPEQDAMDRAKAGYHALRAFRETFRKSCNTHNYGQLVAVLDGFDTAMGDTFDLDRLILIGVMGSAVTALAEDSEFTDMLPTGAAALFAQFGLQIDQYVERFPAWVAYKDDADASNVTSAVVKSEAEAFHAIEADLSASPETDTDVAADYALQVKASL
ncbi:MAG: leucine-rich repeat domain-containing protein [Pseudomonadota bacterium]